MRRAGTGVALVWALLLMAAGLSAQSPAPQAENGKLNFFVLSDWGGKGSPTQVAVGQAMAATAASQKPRFIVTCGDNYHSNGIESPDSPRWKTEYEDIYKDPLLMVPWYPSLGNHDNRGSVEAEIAYSGKSPRWKLPARYHAHTEKLDGTNEVLFAHLDTSPFIKAYHKKGSTYKVRGQDTRAQLRWLERTLADSSARWKIVIGHHPIYSSAPAHGDTKELVEQVLPLLQKHGVRLYFCGHDHVLQHLERGGLNCFVCGGGSTHRVTNERKDVRFGLGSTGFLAVTLSGTEAEARFINEAGKELYRTKIAAP